MAQVTINANRSVHIDASAPTTNNDGAPQIDVGESNSSAELRRGLIGWDTSSIPTNSVINSCDFKIYDGGGDLTNNARDMKVGMLLVDWVENQATWNIRKTATNWDSAGADGSGTDRSASEIGSINMPNPPVAGYKTITLTTSEIQKWFDGTITQNGLTLYMVTESDDMHRFQGSGEANPPQLVIDYTPPVTSSSNGMFLSF